MSSISDDLMKQLRFITAASAAFMRQKKQKLTGQQRALAILAKEDMTQSYLAEVLDLRPSSLAELLKKMEKNGDVIRTEDENDKRVKHVTLTNQGKLKADDLIVEQGANSSDAFFAGLDDEQKLQFGESISRIVNGWSEEFRANSAKFVDPMDRLEAMKKMRQEWFEGDGFDGRKPNADEFRSEMAKHYQNMQNHWRRDHMNHFKDMHQHGHDGETRGFRNPWDNFKD